MREARLKRHDKITGNIGTWRVLQASPPYGKRREWIYTLLDESDNVAGTILESDLFTKENAIVIHKD